MGVKAGSHVALWATNVPQWYIAFWATPKIGAVLVTVNTAYKIHEAEYLLRQSVTHTLIMVQGYRDSHYDEIMAELCPELETLKPGEQLPSVRGLSIELRINPNTIQKAYSELDARGLIQSVPGKGCFVCQDALDALKAAKRQQLSEFSALAAELAASGLSEDELIACIRRAYQTTPPKGKEPTP
jgi:DNA-binding transcriptional regulator YhcF (GntR family)